MFSFDKALGIHQQAVQLRAQRLSMLATNLANTDTPNYKARDLDFRSVLSAQAPRARRTSGYWSDEYVSDAYGWHTTSSASRSRSTGAASRMPAQPMYRQPMQPSLDGNTVEADVEMTQFTENALRYQASLRFISGRLSSLRDAFTGGRQ